VKVALKSAGSPVKGSRVRFGGLVYIVTGAESPTEIDDYTAVTECDVQPADAPRGTKVIEAELIQEEQACRS